MDLPIPVTSFWKWPKKDYFFVVDIFDKSVGSNQIKLKEGGLGKCSKKILTPTIHSLTTVLYLLSFEAFTDSMYSANMVSYDFPPGIWQPRCYIQLQEKEKNSKLVLVLTPPPSWSKTNFFLTLPLGKLHRKKKQTNFGTFPKGGGAQGPIQSKMSTFCHRQVPTRISFILPHIHGGASLFIPHQFYP